MAGAAMILQNRIHGDNYNAVGCQNEEWGEAKRQNPFLPASVRDGEGEGGPACFFIKDEEYKRQEASCASTVAAAAPAISI